MQYLKIIAMIGSLLPMIHQLIIWAEAQFPNAKSGAAKLDAVVTTVTNILPTLGTSIDTIKNIVAPLKATISGMVSVMNTAGTLGNAVSSVVQQSETTASVMKDAPKAQVG